MSVSYFTNPSNSSVGSSAMRGLYAYRVGRPSRWLFMRGNSVITSSSARSRTAPVTRLNRHSWRYGSSRSTSMRGTVVVVVRSASGFSIRQPTSTISSPDSHALIVWYM